MTRRDMLSRKRRPTWVVAAWSALGLAAFVLLSPPSAALTVGVALLCVGAYVLVHSAVDFLWVR